MAYMGKDCININEGEGCGNNSSYIIGMVHDRICKNNNRLADYAADCYRAYSILLLFNYLFKPRTVTGMDYLFEGNSGASDPSV